MILKSLARLLIETFRSRAYCVMKDELEKDSSISEIYVIVRFAMPAITITTLILKKSNAAWHMCHTFRDTKKQREITREYRLVPHEEYQALIDALEKSRHLKHYYGHVKDGVRYEVALSNGRGVLNLTVANPLSGQEHFGLTKEIEETFKSLFGEEKMYR
jgi:hypothetical protein